MQIRAFSLAFLVIAGLSGAAQAEAQGGVGGGAAGNGASGAGPSGVGPGAGDGAAGRGGKSDKPGSVQDTPATAQQNAHSPYPGSAVVNGHHIQPKPLPGSGT